MKKNNGKLVTNSREGYLVERIIVEDLYDTYSYDIETPSTSEAESGKLLLLYGDNGSGKTTILNLVYHLLSPEPYGGHRTYVGGIPFKKFEVYLTNGIIVSAKRKITQDLNKYSINYIDSNIDIDFTWNWHSKQRKKSEHEEIYQNLCNHLKSLNLNLHFLSDTRKTADLRKDNIRNYQKQIQIVDRGDVYLNVDASDEGDPFSTDALLKKSIDDTVQWFRRQALSGTTVGYLSVNEIYKDIIKRIVTFGDEEHSKIHTDIVESLKNDLTKLKNRNSKFAKYGLTPDLDIKDLVKFLGSANSSNVSLLKTVLGPYLDGHKARLDALQDLQNVINEFVSLLTTFYSKKAVEVNIEEGIDIYTSNGKKLSPFSLSSGEKQLLLLFSHAVQARKKGTIFIIDEPEISLNVKWQRKLIKAIMTCLSGTDSQVILATHSIELLAQYSNYVKKLENIERE